MGEGRGGPADEGSMIEPAALLERQLAHCGLRREQIRLRPTVAFALVPHMGTQLWMQTGRVAHEPFRVFGTKIFTPTQSGCRFSIAGPAMGAPFAAMVMEILIALGARTLLALGYCGGIGAGLSIGDIVLPTLALRDEGTSVHYLASGESTRPSAGVMEVVEEQVLEASVPVKRGPVWTTDALFRETAARVERFRSAGALAVEMEVSALCAVAEFRRVEVGAVLVVTDVSRGGCWNTDYGSPAVKQGIENACKLVVAACNSLSA